MRRVVVWMAFLLVTGSAIPMLAEATMSKKSPVPRGSRLEVVLNAETSHEPKNTAAEMARTLFAGCRLQVPARVAESGFEELGGNRFRFVLEPTLNDSDRRQLHGCLEDARLQHLQADVLSMGDL